MLEINSNDRQSQRSIGQVSHEPADLDGGEVMRVGFELELAQGSCAYIGHGNRTGCRGDGQSGGDVLPVGR